MIPGLCRTGRLLLKYMVKGSLFSLGLNSVSEGLHLWFKFLKGLHIEGCWKALSSWKDCGFTMNRDMVWVSFTVFIFFQHMVLIFLTLPVTQLLINSTKKNTTSGVKWKSTLILARKHLGQSLSHLAHLLSVTINYLNTCLKFWFSKTSEERNNWKKIQPFYKRI